MIGVVAAVLQAIERRRLFRAALAYNTSYTFSLSARHGHTWCCPQCGHIHRAHSISKFGGPQFYACCNLPAGSRDARRFAIPNY